MKRIVARWLVTSARAIDPDSVLEVWPRRDGSSIRYDGSVTPSIKNAMGDLWWHVREYEDMFEPNVSRYA